MKKVRVQVNLININLYKIIFKYKFKFSVMLNFNFIQEIVLYLDFKSDESYTPNKISIRAGTSL